MKKDILSRFKNRKPVAVKLAYSDDPRSVYTIHSPSKCVSDDEREIYDTVMDTGKPIEEREFVAIPVYKSGVSGKYEDILRNFQMNNESTETEGGETFVEELKLPRKVINHWNDLLDMGFVDFDEYELDEESTVFQKTVTFPDGCEADLKVNTSYREDGDLYAEAVLFNENGVELSHTDPDWSLDADWSFEVDGVEYILRVVGV